ncbi:MAG: SWIM zinc finger family protein [Desulfobacterales bacterium]|nr:SWIM zinc finger family protein [Desulfobacterales bacterium]
MGYNYWGFPKYVSVGEKKASAKKTLDKLKKTNPNISPIIIEGSKIASTWWGQAWNKNLEKYADYSNRIGRGRSYVRNGSVVDLQINPGVITSLVQGGESKPYSITIQIKEVPPEIWKNIKAECAGKLESLQELLVGKFPKALGEIFTAKGNGLFPMPDEIKFSCSCPDSAYMCKHIAATLYGIGARLDKDPSLFFKLRKLEVNELIAQTVGSKVDELLQKAQNKTSRILSDSNLAGIFGIDFNIDFSVMNAVKQNLSPAKTKKNPKKSKKL